MELQLVYHAILLSLLLHLLQVLLCNTGFLPQHSTLQFAAAISEVFTQLSNLAWL